MAIRKSAAEPGKCIGQLIIVGFDGTEMSTELHRLLTRVQPSGVILFARNIAGAQQTHRLLKDCRATSSLPMFTCVDLEGGRVDRFRNVIGPSPSAAEVFATGDSRLFRKHGQIIGTACRAMGFNTDLAPVVDLAFEESRKVMSSRAVSDDPEQATVYAREFLAGLQLSGVIGAIKHFPGLGGATLDTHLDLPNVDRPWKKLWAEDIMPYRLLRRATPMVLVGHAAYPAVTQTQLPASLSRKWITDVLRKKIGYRGLVVSDDLEMGGVLKAAPIEEAAVEHIRAGGDICLICHREEFVTRAYEAMVHEVERDRRFAARVAESSRRTLAFKKKRTELKRMLGTPNPSRIERLTCRLWEFGEHVRIEALKRQATA
jgi:beta-N-acetylhexosaminidase